MGSLLHIFTSYIEIQSLTNKFSNTEHVHFVPSNKSSPNEDLNTKCEERKKFENKVLII